MRSEKPTHYAGASAAAALDPRFYYRYIESDMSTTDHIGVPASLTKIHSPIEKPSQDV